MRGGGGGGGGLILEMVASFLYYRAYFYPVPFPVLETLIGGRG